MQAAAKLLLYETKQHICSRAQSQRAISKCWPVIMFVYHILGTWCADAPHTHADIDTHTHSTLFHAEGGSLPALRSKQGDNEKNSSLEKLTGTSAVF